MSNFITFHKSVLGYLHKQKQKPCQDCSGDYNGEKEGKPYYIAVIADGHGSSACPRSEIGSQKIVEIVLEDFKEFARTMLKEREQADGTFGIYEQFAICKYQKQMMKNLTDSIISKWIKAVREHLKENDLSEEEIEKSGEFYAEQYRRREHLEHLYGTTVIAALRLPDYLVLIQQGDGRCDVFYEDNTVDQPIPWDPRCHENITTSMCDVDVLQSIRSKVILLKEKSVIACYMGSDGVEDSYIDSSLEEDDEHYMEGTHMFYRDITCKLLDFYEPLPLKKDCKRALEEFLEKWLPDFSETGSGDDVSVSGIIDLEKVRNFKENFETDVKRYYLQDKLRKWEERLASMERKYGILEERSNKIQQKRENTRGKYKKSKEKIETLEKDIFEKKNLCNKKKKEYKSLVAQKDKFESDLKKIQTEKDKQYFVEEHMNKICRELKETVRAILKDFEENIQKDKENIEKQEENLKDLDKELQRQRKIEQDAQKELENLKENLAQQEFREYEKKYIEVQEEIERIRKEIKENKIGSL